MVPLMHVQENRLRKEHVKQIHVQDGLIGPNGQNVAKNVVEELLQSHVNVFMETKDKEDVSANQQLRMPVTRMIAPPGLIGVNLVCAPRHVVVV